MDCSMPGSSVHGIFQARIRQWLSLPTPGIPHILPPLLEARACLWTMATRLFLWRNGQLQPRSGPQEGPPTRRRGGGASDSRSRRPTQGTQLGHLDPATEPPVQWVLWEPVFTQKNRNVMEFLNCLEDNFFFFLEDNFKLRKWNWLCLAEAKVHRSWCEVTSMVGTQWDTLGGFPEELRRDSPSSVSFWRITVCGGGVQSLPVKCSEWIRIISEKCRVRWEGGLALGKAWEGVLGAPMLVLSWPPPPAPPPPGPSPP